MKKSRKLVAQRVQSYSISLKHPNVLLFIYGLIPISGFKGFNFIVILCELFDYSEIIRKFAAENKKITIMTAIELNAQIWRDMAEIADSEPLMKQLAKYLKKLVAKKTDQTLMTKEEFFAKLDEAERQIERGEYSVMLPGEDLTEHLKRLGYDI